MSKDPEPRRAPASLVNDESRGGPTAVRGFDFQRAYALILLIESLRDPDWSAVLVEGAEDVEARFDRQGGVERRAIQLKNYRVTAATAREIVKHLQKLNEDSPGTWTAFVIACTELDDTLKTIHNGLERYRGSGSFYAADETILANTRAEVERQIAAAKLPVEFVLERVTFQPGLQPYKEEEWVRARALDRLHKAYPRIGHTAAEEIYLRFKDLVAESTARPIERQQVMAIIDAVRAEPFEVSAHAAPPPLTPADELPGPGLLPPGSRLPFARNRLFAGRVESLKAVAQALLYDVKAPTGAAYVVHGLGGVGKTQLAVQFAYRYGRYFQGVHWLNAAQPAALGAEVAACGARMELEPWPEKLPEQMARTLRAWQEMPAERPRLIVLDNLEDVEAARKWLPQLEGPGIRLLLTARQPDWPDDLELGLLPLQVLSAGESRTLLRQYLDEQRTGDAEMIGLAEWLGRLPLALELAGRYLKRQPRLPVAEYARMLEKVLEDPAMKGWRKELRSPAGHDLGLAATLAVSWAELKDEAVRRVFMTMWWCAPNQRIPPGVVQKAAGLDKERCDEAVGMLAGLGLVEWDDPEAGPAIHPLLMELGRKVLTLTPGSPPSKGEEDEAPLAAMAESLAELATEANQTELPGRFIPLRAHVEAVAGWAEAAVPSEGSAWLETAGVLWNSLGSHLQDVADYAGARAAFERALAIAERLYGHGHPNVATAVNKLGGVLRDLGDLTEARAACERALAIDERVYGPDHPNVARDVDCLGRVLSRLGDHIGARAAFERTLGIWRAVQGEEHPQVAAAHTNLGSELIALGDLAGARTARERALAINERVYGPDHREVAISVYLLGWVLKSLGDLAEARAAFERALAIDERIYGPDHGVVADDVTSLGSVLQDLGDLAGARAAFERALAIAEWVYGPDDESTATMLWWLGTVARLAGHWEEAWNHLQEALRRFEKRLPAEDFRIVRVRQELETLAWVRTGGDT